MARIWSTGRGGGFFWCQPEQKIFREPGFVAFNGLIENFGGHLIEVG
jgi:hypothetical protein